MQQYVLRYMYYYMYMYIAIHVGARGCVCVCVCVCTFMLQGEAEWYCVNLQRMKRLC